jgi:hypothetical protein
MAHLNPILCALPLLGQLMVGFEVSLVQLEDGQFCGSPTG